MSNTQDELNILFKQYNQKLSNVMPQAVGYNIALCSGISLVTILAFNLLRPRNKVIYEPKAKYYEGDKKPPRINNGFFDWVSPVIHTKEDELLQKIGLDAVAFLRFLRMMRWLFISISILCCAVLIPVDLTYNIQHVNKDNRNFLSSFTIQNIDGWRLFIHVGMSYVITFLVMGFVWWHWKCMLKLRNDYFRSDEYNKSFFARTLMITNVPNRLQSDESLKNLLSTIKMPYPTTAVQIGHQVGQLPDLVEYHNETVREFETVLVQYLKGGKIGKKRPTITVGGFLGLGGEKKDAIDFYTNKLKRTEDAVEKWRNNFEKTKSEPYGFASLASVPYAHIAARKLHKKHPKGTTILLAPNPADIIWKNLTKSETLLAHNKMMGWIFLALVCFFNTIPLLIISLLANLAALSQIWPFLNTWLEADKFSFSLVSGILPPTVSAIFTYFLPIIMRKLSKYQGAITRSRLDRAVVARLFAFLIISQLFVFSLIGVIFTTSGRVASLIQKHASVSAVFKELSDLPGSIQSTYLEQASYWLTFFPLRGFLAVFDLAQLINLLWMGIKTRLFGRTVRDIREWTKPPVFEFAIYFSNMLFMAAVALVYAPLAPLVPVAAAVVFIVSSIVYKYQLMFVFVSKVESGGRLWNPVINRLLFSLILMHLLMTLTVGLQMGWRSWYWVSALPPILITAFFKVFVIRRFGDEYQFWIPTEQEIANSRVSSERSDSGGGKLEKRFGHPALHSELFTPLLQDKMMHLLPQVYQGRLGSEKKALAEYGGQKIDTQIVAGGVRIAGIAESQLEYDLAQYQRERGQSDWDNRSMASSSHFGDTTSTKGMHPAGYNQYMQQGPSKVNVYEPEAYELSAMNANPETPLLYGNQPAFNIQQSVSRESLGSSLYPAQPQQPVDSYGQHLPPPNYPAYSRQASRDELSAPLNAGDRYAGSQGYNDRGYATQDYNNGQVYNQGQGYSDQSYGGQQYGGQQRDGQNYGQQGRRDPSGRWQ